PVEEPAALPASPASDLEVRVPEPPARPRVVTIDLERSPAGLVVELDGQPASVPLTIPFGAASHELRLAAPGFRAEVLRVDGRRDRTIVLNMQAIPVAAPAVAPKA